MDDLSDLKREAKRLHKAYLSGDRQAVLQTAQLLGGKTDLKHADFLHAVARGRGFASWPKLKVAAEVDGLGYAEAQARFRAALVYGQKAWIDRLIARWPEITRANFAVACATYDVATVRAALTADASLAVTEVATRRPILHLCFSQWGRLGYGDPADALRIAELLLENGADVNDGFPAEPGQDHHLRALYGAIEHARNLLLAGFLLDHGADPNDNESLYHATEQRDGAALRLLLDHGADPKGTNALYRAMDFNDLAQVEALIAAGANPNEAADDHPSGEVMDGLVGLHHAVQRMCGAPMIRLLVARGAYLETKRAGLTAYALARVYRNEAAAEALAEAGADTTLPPEVEKLVTGSGPLDMAKLPAELATLAVELAPYPEALPTLKALIAAGLPWDAPNLHGLTPVQAAGWHGLPETMAYLLSMKPDLGHVNGYGGTLLSTIIHGSENAPDEGSDHIACLELALREGVALPLPAIRHAGREDVVLFLEDWAESHPGQVTQHGIA